MHVFGIAPVLMIISVAVLVGVGIRIAIHHRNRKWTMSERSQAITWWVTAAIAAATAAIFILFVSSAAGIILAVLYLALGAACIGLGRRHWNRQPSGQ